jgi:putative tryptophan/tyrosine transport system substrate-binding protein
MINQRIFSVALSCLLFAVCFRAEAQQSKNLPRIGILPPGPMSERKHLWESFNQGMRELGYVDGQNISVVLPSTEVKPEELPHLAAELVSLKVDIIVAATMMSIQAAQRATKTIPIVMPVSTDPVETGLVASLARPGGNITGLTLISSQLTGKRLELLKEILPRLPRIAVLSNPTNAAFAPQMRETTLAAKGLGLQLDSLEVRRPDEFEKVLQAATKQGARALIILDDAVFFTNRSRVVKLAAKIRLPAIYGFGEFVEAGGLMSYAANLTDMYRRAPAYVDKILKGAKPGELPIEQPTKFELILNLKAAKQIGLTIPPNVLARADKVIR